MADGLELGDVVRRAAEANARLYRGWLELSLDYLRSVTELLDPEGGSSAPTPAPASPDAPATPASAAQANVPGGAVILEGVAGATAVGAFLLTNDLGRPLDCVPVAGTFSGPDGDAAQPEVTFEPRSIRLDPGEQRVVKVALAVGDSLPTGVAYTADIGIQGLKGFSVPVVLRRQDDIDASPIERVAEQAAVTSEPAQTKAMDSSAKPSAAKGTAATASKTAEKGAKAKSAKTSSAKGGGAKKAKPTKKSRGSKPSRKTAGKAKKS